MPMTMTLGHSSSEYTGLPDELNVDLEDNYLETISEIREMLVKDKRLSHVALDARHILDYPHDLLVDEYDFIVDADIVKVFHTFWTLEFHEKHAGLIVEYLPEEE